MKLSPFTDDNIRQYLSARIPDTATSGINFLNRHERIKEFCRNPIHLMMYAEFIQSDREDEVSSIADLYASFVTKTLQDNFGVLTDWPLTERLQFIRQLAFKWFTERVFEWPEDLFKDFITASVPRHAGDTDLYTRQLLNCSVFTRVVNKFRFVHFSLIEYFVADLLVDDLMNKNVTSWGLSPYYTDIYELIYQMLSSNSFSKVPIAFILENGTRMAASQFYCDGI